MVEPRIQRRLAAIAIADVVGYSRMMGRDESGTLAAINACTRQIVEPVVAEHQGRIVKLMGDGFFIEFASAVNAVEAALDLQARMAEANAGLPDDKRIVLRIGINLGEVIVQGDDLFGDGVNIAARLESIAPQGGIAISASACDQVRGRIDAAIEDRGLQALKNIAEPVHVYWVGGSAADSHSAATTPAAASEGVTIAILPFANLGDDAAQGFFSDGVTEDIITELSRWRSLAVRSRAASFRYRGVSVDIRQVARELGVRFIVEGSVRRMGDRIRIGVQLIDTETATHVWAEKFDRPADDIFLVQDEVVRTVVSTLVGRMQSSDIGRARRRPPSSLAAYECVLEGNALNWDTPDGRAEATALFEQAVALDPGYGFAHAMLSAMRYDQWFEDFDDGAAYLDEALALATRAVLLDENESTCFSMLAWVCLYRRQFDLALQHERRALALNPTNQWNTADMGGLMMYLGKPDEALDWLRRAREIDPYFTTSWYWRCLGLSHMLLQEYAQGLEMLERASARTFRICALMAVCHARLGDLAAAHACAQECLRRKPEFTVAAFMGKEPFKSPEHAAQQTQSLLMAGLPP